MKKHESESTDAVVEAAMPLEQHDEPKEEAAHEVESETEQPAAEEKSKSKIQPLKLRLMERWRQFRHIYLAKLRLSIPLTVVAVVLLLVAVPLSRYTLVGLVTQQDMTVSVVDSRSGTPVSKAQVTLNGRWATTDANGQAHVHTNVGYRTLSVTKQYYQTYSQTQLVDLAAANNHVTIKLVAVGRLVPVTVTNKLTGKAVAGATVKALNSEAVTGTDDTATVVLPVALTTQKVTVSGKGFNDLSGTLQVTDQKVAANSFAVVPAGKLYFLSNQSGKIDVVKTDLDGSNRQTVLAGTGFENSYDTALLASRDWKYLALYAQRTAKGNPEIDLIDTSNDQMTNIDEGDANFSLVGWDGDKFIYQVNRSNVNQWQNGQHAIKSFDATNKKITTLAETTASGDQYNAVYQYFGSVYLLSDKIVYSLNWGTNNYYNYSLLNGKQATLNEVNPDGTGKTVVKSFSLAAGTQTSEVSISTIPYDQPGNIALFLNGDNSNFYEYSNGKVVKADDITAQDFYSSNYPTYLQSPSGNQVFWSVYADGKNNLKVGDSNAQNPQVIASESDYSPYGWFTDDYLLVQKSGSELYVMSSDGKSQPFKVTNYYKPDTSYRGYGGGYGGL